MVRGDKIRDSLVLLGLVVQVTCVFLDCCRFGLSVL